MGIRLKVETGKCLVVLPPPRAAAAAAAASSDAARFSISSTCIDPFGRLPSPSCFKRALGVSSREPKR